jgi:hypothetical protein
MFCCARANALHLIVALQLGADPILVLGATARGAFLFPVFGVAVALVSAGLASHIAHATQFLRELAVLHHRLPAREQHRRPRDNAEQQAAAEKTNGTPLGLASSAHAFAPGQDEKREGHPWGREGISEMGTHTQPTTQ